MPPKRGGAGRGGNNAKSEGQSSSKNEAGSSSEEKMIGPTSSKRGSSNDNFSADSRKPAELDVLTQVFVQVEEKTLQPLFQSRLAQTSFFTGKTWAPVLRVVILGVICLLAFCIRLFAVIRFESVIHEFDPYFNYRTTNYLSEHGFLEFWNWFDDQSWYPLGRVIGHTLFPGLMTTTAVLKGVLHSIGLVVNVRNLCVFMGPTFAAFTSLSAYCLTKEITSKPEAGLVAAFFMAICPSYLSRSVAGSYDNECVAIFALVFAFYNFIRAVKEGTMFHAVLASFSYLYMVSTWGGYVFLTNTIAIYAFALLCLDRLSGSAYVAYCLWYVLGTVFCLNIPFVNMGAVKSSEHLASHGIFMLCQAYKLSKYVLSLKKSEVFTDLLTGLQTEGSGTSSVAASSSSRSKGSMSRGTSGGSPFSAPNLAGWKIKTTKFLLSGRGIIAVILCFFLLLVTYLTMTGKSQWSGRSLTLLDPTYARNYIPIIASVSEHQPTTWINYVMDLHVMVFLLPLGLFHCFWNRSFGLLFLGVFGLLSTYFSGVMIRLLLVMSPACCCLSGLGTSHVLTVFMTNLRHCEPPKTIAKHFKTSSILVASVLFFTLAKYVTHCTMISSTAYSSPSIVMASNLRDGTRIIQDDFREAYYWIRQNTHKKATIASWWDYGYQLTVMANRTVIVDNNTWNNTHIATIGLVLGSDEKTAWKILKSLDADYFLVLSGSVARYSSDDVNKFLWPVRIAQGVYPNRISESDFIGPGGYTTGQGASEKFLNSLIYKLAFHRLAEITGGQDMIRGTMLAKPEFELTHFTEVFTSENWIVRIFALNKENNRIKFEKNAESGSAGAKTAAVE
ncbi:unnamed protein product [Amoebophrya sp. A120]|nr:unnamed protein product [Amoebophrya sp. A120]|eukprot:GSA120T00024707001.1